MEFKDTSLETKSSLRYGEPMIAEKKYKKTALLKFSAAFLFLT